MSGVKIAEEFTVWVCYVTLALSALACTPTSLQDCQIGFLDAKFHKFGFLQGCRVVRCRRFLGGVGVRFPNNTGSWSRILSNILLKSVIRLFYTVLGVFSLTLSDNPYLPDTEFVQFSSCHCRWCSNMLPCPDTVYANCTIKTLHGAFCTLVLIADNGYSARQAVKVTSNALFSKAFVYCIGNVWNTCFTAVWLLRGYSWHDLLPFADVWKFAHNPPPKNACKLIVHERSIAPETEDV